MELEQAERILNVKKNDDIEIIRNKYKELAKQYHPDKIGNNENIYKINMAFNILENYKENEANKIYISMKFKVVDDAVIMNNKVDKKDEPEKESETNYIVNNIDNIINKLLEQLKNEYDEKIIDMFKSNYKIINIAINTILFKAKNDKEIIESIFNSLKSLYKKTGIKFTQKHKFQMMDLIFKIYKINISVNNTLDILGIKKSVEKLNKNTKSNNESININNDRINLSIINAVCKKDDYIELLQNKEMNMRIKIISNNDSYDKMLSLKYIYHLEDAMHIICVDNKCKTYKLSYL